MEQQSDQESNQWLDRRLGEINRARFDGDNGWAKLVTNALFDRGYSRFDVRQPETEARWVIWAKSAQAIRDARPEYALTITPLPVGWFFAKRQMNVYGQGQMTGDRILFEECADVDSATADTVGAWLATPAHLRAEKFPDCAA